MKTIGFIDYYISEWHANNYPKWIKEASGKVGCEFKVGYVYAELDISPVDGVSTDEWCDKFGAERCGSISELCERADYICILSPSNPEKHLEYAKEAFKCGKPTYVDKTFAENLSSAREIFSLGEKYGTPFFSSSALRYAEELSELSCPECAVIIGPGSNFDEYIIHLLEITVKLFGTHPVRIKAENQGKNQSILRLELEGGRVASIAFSPSAPYSVICEKEDGTTVCKAIQPGFFPSLIESILRFYLTGKVPFSGEETLAVMKIRDGALKAHREPDRWISLGEQ